MLLNLKIFKINSELQPSPYTSESYKINTSSFINLLLLTVTILLTLNVNKPNRYDYEIPSHQKDYRDSNSNTDFNYNGQHGKDKTKHMLTTYYSQ